jgi:hypothetical protein
MKRDGKKVYQPKVKAPVKKNDDEDWQATMPVEEPVVEKVVEKKSVTKSVRA